MDAERWIDLSKKTLKKTQQPQNLMEKMFMSRVGALPLLAHFGQVPLCRLSACVTEQVWHKPEPYWFICHDSITWGHADAGKGGFVTASCPGRCRFCFSLCHTTSVRCATWNNTARYSSNSKYLRKGAVPLDHVLSASIAVTALARGRREVNAHVLTSCNCWKVKVQYILKNTRIFFFPFVLQDTKFPSLGFATKKVTTEDCCLCQLDYIKMLMKAHLMHLPGFRKAILLRESLLLLSSVTVKWEQTVHWSVNTEQHSPVSAHVFVTANIPMYSMIGNRRKNSTLTLDGCIYLCGTMKHCLGVLRCASFPLCLQQKACLKMTWGPKFHLQLFLYEHEPMPALNITSICFEPADHFRKKINEDDDVLEAIGLNCRHMCIETFPLLFYSELCDRV